MRKIVVEPRRAVFDAFSVIAALYCGIFAFVYLLAVGNAFLSLVHFTGCLLVVGNWIMVRLTGIYGLGLYITKQAIELAGGELGFESRENSGSTFWFTLPVGGPPPKES